MRNGADNAVVVTRGTQEHGNGPCHDNGVQVALVAVAIHHHHITSGYCVVPHHFIAGTGAVSDKEAVVGIENTRGITLALTNGAIVVQQLAQLLYRVTHVGAQHVLTIELVVHLPNR